MSLFTDSDQVTQSDMALLDPEIPDIIAAEGLTDDQVSATLQHAWEASSGAIIEATRPYYESYPDPIIAFHTYGRFSPVQQSRIVVTSEYAMRQSPMQSWMTRVALENFYMEMTNRRDNDRYTTKLDSAQGYTKSAWRAVVSAGLSTVTSPLACPGATHELGAGLFAAANVTSVAGGTDAEATWGVAISWVNNLLYQSPQFPRNAESGPSLSITFTVPVNNRLSVNILGLNAPGSLTIPRPITKYYFSQVATHWNIYVGQNGGQKYLQNPSLIPLSQTEYDFSAAPVLSGNPMWSGQVADSVQPITRIAGIA